MSHYAPLVAALVTMLIITVILHSRFGKEIQDIPNERSLHATPTPRIGGVGLMAGLLTGWALMFSALTWWLVLPLMGLFVVSLIDDMVSLPVRQRFFIHLIAGAILVAGAGLITQHGLIASIMTLLLCVWCINLYNFMDGSDGLAGGMAMFGFTFYGIAALMAHDDLFAMLNFTIGAAALGFLYHNFHPAKVFMGDAGSIPLGFLAAGMGVFGWQHHYWHAWFPLMVFSPFFIDASATLVKRYLRGVKVTEAHREHYYQRLIQLGWGHRNVALVEYGLMFAVGISALIFVHDALPWTILVVWSLIYSVLMWSIDVSWKKYSLGQNA